MITLAPKWLVKLIDQSIDWILKTLNPIIAPNEPKKPEK